MWKIGVAVRTTDDNIRRMRFACRITKATNTYTYTHTQTHTHTHTQNM